MEQVYSHVSALQQECVRLCAELKECLEEERRLLVEYSIDKLPHNTLLKESLVSTLGRKRRELREYLRLRFDVSTAEEATDRFPEEFAQEWAERAAQWRELWEMTRKECVRNQQFLEHSVRNIGLLVDNLKHVFGEGSVYGNKGQKVDMKRQGKVLQGKY